MDMVQHVAFFGWISIFQSSGSCPAPFVFPVDARSDEYVIAFTDIHAQPSAPPCFACMVRSIDTLESCRPVRARHHPSSVDNRPQFYHCQLECVLSRYCTA